MKNPPKKHYAIVMMGATGAVGTEVLKTLLKQTVSELTLLGRRPVEIATAPNVRQHKIDIHRPESYQDYLKEHDVAICTLGVGQPSKMSKEEFVKIDKTAVLNFATECKRQGVRHFELLASVGIDPMSSSFYLRTKGELVEELRNLEFERLSIFKPSMILTPNNRYGLLQGITLKIWPLLNPLLLGGFTKYRGVKVEKLGEAIAMNVFQNGGVYETLEWQDFSSIVAK